MIKRQRWYRRHYTQYESDRPTPFGDASEISEHPTVKNILLRLRMSRRDTSQHVWYRMESHPCMVVATFFLTTDFTYSDLSDVDEIINVIETLFEAGITKDMSRLKDIHLDDPEFSSFSDLPPYDLKDRQTTIELEELRFVSISDYSYQISNPKISVFGDAAVVAMELNQSGMLVDNKAYTGEHMLIKGRATFVLLRRPTWKIVHIHLSRIS